MSARAVTLALRPLIWLIEVAGMQSRREHTLRKTFAAVAGALVLAALSSGASAAPLSQALSVEVEAGSLVQKVHGCHRDVQEGRYGWHYHAGYNCDRYDARPPRQHYAPPRQHYAPQREYRRAPVCRRECNYVGPIKICKDRCY